MGSRVTCVFYERTETAQRSLRRHAIGPCPNMPGEHGYHNARVVVADQEPFAGSEWDGGMRTDPTAEEKQDLRWPKTCACGYAFTEGDQWQVVLERLFRSAQDGSLRIEAKLPPGALWYRDRWGERFGRVGPDGHTLVVKLPDGTDWQPDFPAGNSGTPWTRTGDVPRVTCRPSIASPGYHGFLTDGVLEEC